MASVKYDPAIIETVARRLNARANNIVVLSVVLGLLLGSGLGVLVGALVAGSSWPMALAACAVMLGAVGYSIGSERALTLRLQAQLLLCQVSIERNTFNMYRWLLEQIRLQAVQEPRPGGSQVLAVPPDWPSRPIPDPSRNSNQ